MGGMDSVSLSLVTGNYHYSFLIPFIDFIICRFFSSSSYSQTWTVAKSVCEDNGASLAIIDNKAEKDWLATRSEQIYQT
jgi:hypothetical protein